MLIVLCNFHAVNLGSLLIDFEKTWKEVCHALADTLWEDLTFLLYATPSLVGWILCHTVFGPVLFVLYLSRVSISPYFRDTQKDKTTTHCLRERPHLQYLLCLKNTKCCRKYVHVHFGAELHLSLPGRSWETRAFLTIRICAACTLSGYSASTSAFDSKNIKT